MSASESDDETPDYTETSSLTVPKEGKEQGEGKCRGVMGKLKMKGIVLYIMIIIAMFVTQIGFSGYSIVLKAFAEAKGVEPLIFSMLRDAFCFPLLLVVAFLVEGVKYPKLRHVPLFFALGFFGVFGNQLLFIMGLYYTSPSNASIFQPIIPVLTAILAVIIRIEPLNICKRMLPTIISVELSFPSTPELRRIINIAPPADEQTPMIFTQP
eukprot:CAMPEP_0174256012 /NCGR_PEP_ID=MMETSP0439-20130205/5288_1 /TAXON_ID=0 /ORGANISM="Stereomyxa ramosa, Strain Chinc5" /LENGTH=210 /DNA_ID=CAMNT_0015338439 /DNA_START=44 /DNA_END=672 /DNA_ORIENTATION=-